MVIALQQSVNRYTSPHCLDSIIPKDRWDVKWQRGVRLLAAEVNLGGCFVIE
jgi:hypothetical protein